MDSGYHVLGVSPLCVCGRALGAGLCVCNSAVQLPAIVAFGCLFFSPPSPVASSYHCCSVCCSIPKSLCGSRSFMKESESWAPCLSLCCQAYQAQRDACYLPWGGTLHSLQGNHCHPLACWCNPSPDAFKEVSSAEAGDQG